MSRWWGRSRGRGYGGWGGFAPYVPVAERRAKAAKLAKKLAAGGTVLLPVSLESKTIALTFWGKAWCENLESYSDYANRLPRGRTYVRNGSVLHLDIRKGEIEAMVSGSEIYKIRVKVSPVKKERWTGLCRECAGSIGSLVELLGGKLSERVMGVMTRHESGLFPAPKEITLDCSCPDSAVMCKHVAAVLYGVGARLDKNPELLFLLRHVDHRELVSQASTVTALTDGGQETDAATLDAAQVGEVFGIELASDAPVEAAAPPAPDASVPKRKQRVAKTQAPKRKPARRRSKRPARKTALVESSE